MSESLSLQTPTGNDKAWSMLSHLSGFLGVPFLLPLVVYFAMRRESQFVRSHAGAALNFHLSTLLYTLLCIPLCWIVIGIPVLIGLWIWSLVLSILATVAASRGEHYVYPLTIRFFS